MARELTEERIAELTEVVIPTPFGEGKVHEGDHGTTITFTSPAAYEWFMSTSPEQREGFCNAMAATNAYGIV